MDTTTAPTEELFKNPLLKLLATTNRPLTVSYVLVYTILLLYIHAQLLPEERWFVTVAVGFAGLFSWTLFEYLLHRYLFHITGDSAAIKRFAYIMHGVHHENPREEKWVFMPPVPGTLYILIFGAAFYLLLGAHAAVFLAGFILGYLAYANIHFYVHIKRPDKRFAFFWRHHSLHHYKYPDKAFGVSTPLWDIIFRTMPPEKKTHLYTVKSEYTKELPIN